jgi:hypothetical protein
LTDGLGGGALAPPPPLHVRGPTGDHKGRPYEYRETLHFN